MSDPAALMIFPRLRVQNANCISSPLTWGFPSMTAFVGLMHALERRIPSELELMFNGVGVVCHAFDAQVTNSGLPRTFHLTRNPVAKDGSTAAIVEEGRAHLDVTMVFDVSGRACSASEVANAAVATQVGELVAQMRIAGGSVLTPCDGKAFKPRIVVLEQDDEERRKQFRGLRRRWLPGFCLVGRDDLLRQRLDEMRQTSPTATHLDAWLDLAALHIEPTARVEGEGDHSDAARDVAWEARRRPGWIVPIPAGYAALTRLFQPGEVTNARDPRSPFRFVESVYSLAEWISPHRLGCVNDMMWYPDMDPDNGLYRCRNDYRPTPVIAE